MSALGWLPSEADCDTRGGRHRACLGDKMDACLSAKFLCSNPNTQCDGIRRCGLWEGLSHEGGAVV